MTQITNFLVILLLYNEKEDPSMKQNPWELIASIQTLSISSINENHTAHSSYAPFIENKHKFYVCISGMAKHAQNLLNNKNISCLIIEDESKSTNIFARKRVTFDMQVTPIERNSLIFNGAMTLFRDKFGDSARIYESMLDFQLFELTPLLGRAVFGFGEAYDFRDGDFTTNATGMMSK